MCIVCTLLLKFPNPNPNPNRVLTMRNRRRRYRCIAMVACRPSRAASCSTRRAGGCPLLWPCPHSSIALRGTSRSTETGRSSWGRWRESWRVWRSVVCCVMDCAIVREKAKWLATSSCGLRHRRLLSSFTQCSYAFQLQISPQIIP